MRQFIFLLLLSLFYADKAYAVTRSCDSSSHRVSGIVIGLNNQLHTMEANIPMVAVRQTGSYWYPPTARRRACRKASRLATQLLAAEPRDELGRYLCLLTKSKKVKPLSVKADAWHGSENNNHERSIESGWISCSGWNDKCITDTQDSNNTGCSVDKHNIKRYFYNSKIGKCEEMYGGGCPDEPPFSTKNECKVKCEAIY